MLVLVVVGLAYIGWQILRYVNEEYVVTSRRVLQLEGVINKRVRDSSLEKINDAVLTQSLFGRIFGFGDMNIDSASDDGEINLIDVPKVDKTKALLYQLAEDDRSRRAGASEDGT